MRICSLYPKFAAYRGDQGVIFIRSSGRLLYALLARALVRWAAKYWVGVMGRGIIGFD
jgi:hypothetical protein